MDISDTLPSLALERYNGVSAFDALFHIVKEKRYKQALRKVRLMLRSGGLFVFSDLLVHSGPRLGEHLACRGLNEATDWLACENGV